MVSDNLVRFYITLDHASNSHKSDADFAIWNLADDFVAI